MSVISIPRRGWWVAAFLVSFLAAGSVLWTTPYAKLSLPDSLLNGIQLFVVLAAVIARVPGGANFLRGTLLAGVAVPAANAARVFADTATDPTSHNLWPIELFLSGLVGFGFAAAGSLGVTVWTRLAGRK